MSNASPSAMYAPLRVHGHHSMLTGVDSPAALVARARELGLEALALCDVDTLAGVVEFLNAVRAANEDPTLPPPLPDQPPMVILPTTSRLSIAIQGRSLYEMMYYLSQNVEVPEGHYQKGLVNVTTDEYGRPFDWDELLRGVFRVRVSRFWPKDAYLAVPYRGYWYSIADNDLDTKATLNLLEEIFSLQVRGGGDKLPLLTLGIGR